MTESRPHRLSGISPTILVWGGIGLAILLSVMDLLGWVLDIPPFRSLGPHWVAMKAVVAVCLLLSASALVCLGTGSPSRRRALLSQLLGAAVGLVGLLSIVAWAVREASGREWSWTRLPFLGSFLAPDGRMALLAAILFLAFGCALVVLGVGRAGADAFAHALLILPCMLAYQVLVGYVLDVEALHQWMRQGVALNTGLAFLGLCAAALHLRPGTWLMRVFLQEGAGAQMARLLLPALLFLPLAITWLRLRGERSGLFESDLGVALVAVAYAVCLVAITWLSALSVNRTDRQRREAEEALRKAHAELEIRVQERTAALQDTAGALETERRRFKDVLDLLPAYVILLDQDYRVPFANRFFEGRFGRSEGRRCYEYLFGRTESCESCETFKVLDTKTPHHWEWKGPDGRDYDIHDFLFTDSDGSTLILEVGADITERKRVEAELEVHRGHLEDLVRERTAALAASEERLRMAQANARVWVWEWDPRTGGLRGSPELEALHGVPPGWFKTYEDLRTLVHPDDIGRVEAERNAAVAEGEPFDLEYRVLLSDGETRWISTRGMATRDADGAVLRVSGVSLDITPGKRAEEELRRSAEWLGIGQRAANAGFWDWDVATGTLTWSEEFCALFGLAPTVEASFESWLAVLHPDDRDTAMARIEKAVREKTPLENEYRILLPGGRERWIGAWGNTAYDESGNPRHMSGICIDITERKNTENALRRSEATMRGILDATKESIWLFSPEGTVLTANPIALERFGRKAEEVIGRTFSEILPPELAESRLERLRETAATGRPVEFYDVRGGMCFHHSFYPVPGEDGRLAFVASFSRDVTESRRREAALRESREDLNRAQAVSHTGSWRLDVRRNELLWSDEAHRIFGVAAGTPMTYETFLGVVHPDDRERVHREWSAALRGEPYDVEHRVLADGAVKWVRERAELEFDEGGELLGGFGSSQDITELKRAEEALRESEERYRTLFDRMTEGFALHEIICDADGRPWDYRFLEVNPSFERLTGLKRADVVGRTFREVLPNDSPAWVEKYGEVALTGKPGHLHEYSPALGRFYEAFAYCPAPRRFAVVFMDVTERRRAEQRSGLLSRTAAELLRTSDPEGLVGDLCREVMAFLDCQVFLNFLADEERRLLHLNACAGITEEEAHRVERIDYGVSVCGCTARDRQAVVVEDALETCDARAEVVKSFGVKAYACHPLMAGARLLGTLAFGTRSRSRFAEGDLALMRAVTDLVAVAMERQRLLREVEGSARTAHRHANELDAIFSAITEAVVVADPAGAPIKANPAAVKSLGLDPVAAGPEAAGRLSVSDSMGNPVRLAYPAPVPRGQPSAMQQRLEMTNAEGRELVIHLSSAPLPSDIGPPGRVVVWHEVTLQERAEKALRRALDRAREREAEITALLASTRAALHHQSFDGAAPEVLRNCQETVGARWGSLALLPGEGAGSGVPASAAGCGGTPELSERARRLQKESVLSGEARYQNGSAEGGAAGEEPDAFLFAPLVVGREVRGMLTLAGKVGGFTDNDARMASAFGEIAALALAQGRASAQIKASLLEKEVLLKEIHHRVKNNLQIIASMLALQAESIKDEEDRAPLLESQNRVRTLALIHEKLYGSQDLRRIPFDEYAAELSSTLFRTLQAGRVALDLDLEPAHLEIATAIPVALVLNEFLSNAIKHAFPQGRPGRVKVGLRRLGGGRCELSVSDDGVGLREGLDIENTESLGLQIVHVLSKQLGAAVEVRSDGGTRFALTFEEGA